LTLHTPKRAAYITTITSPSLHVSCGPATRDTIVGREVTCPQLPLSACMQTSYLPFSIMWNAALSRLRKILGLGLLCFQPNDTPTPQNAREVDGARPGLTGLQVTIACERHARTRIANRAKRKSIISTFFLLSSASSARQLNGPRRAVVEACPLNCFLTRKTLLFNTREGTTRRHVPPSNMVHDFRNNVFKVRSC
jgi:hypothetical protein